VEEEKHKEEEIQRLTKLLEEAELDGRRCEVSLTQFGIRRRLREFLRQLEPTPAAWAVVVGGSGGNNTSESG